MCQCKKDVTPLLTHWSYVFLALTHRDVGDLCPCQCWVTSRSITWADHWPPWSPGQAAIQLAQVTSGHRQASVPRKRRQTYGTRPQHETPIDETRLSMDTIIINYHQTPYFPQTSVAALWMAGLPREMAGRLWEDWMENYEWDWYYWNMYSPAEIKLSRTWKDMKLSDITRPQVSGCDE